MVLIPRRALLGATLVFVLRPAQAIVVEGRNFDERIRIADTDLQLNGIGLRAVAWAKGYVAALYLTQKATTAAQVAAARGPKRLRLVMLLDAPAADFARSFNNGVRRNSSEATLASLRERMAGFSRTIEQLGNVKKGDTVDLDFIPGYGLLFKVNGAVKGPPVPGEDMYAALLRIFVGGKPIDPEMKAGLLGGPIG